MWVYDHNSAHIQTVLLIHLVQYILSYLNPPQFHDPNPQILLWMSLYVYEYLNGYEYHCSLSTLLSKLYPYPNEFSGVRVSEDLYFVLQISGRLQNSANSSLSNYLSDQTIQDSWNSAQESVRTCYNLWRCMEWIIFLLTDAMLWCSWFHRLSMNLQRFICSSICRAATPLIQQSWWITTCPDMLWQATVLV